VLIAQEVTKSRANGGRLRAAWRLHNRLPPKRRLAETRGNYPNVSAALPGLSLARVRRSCNLISGGGWTGARAVRGKRRPACAHGR
jgi:hypothetical protein